MFFITLKEFALAACAHSAARFRFTQGMTLEAPPSDPAVAVPPPSPADAGTKRKAEDPPTPAAARASDDADGPKHASDSATAGLTKMSYRRSPMRRPRRSRDPGIPGARRRRRRVRAQGQLRGVFVLEEGYSTSQSELRAATGAWYFEVVVARLGDAGHARVGWAERLAETDAPVGADASGYAYCDVGGGVLSRHAGPRAVRRGVRRRGRRGMLPGC